jgi:hypothetical protein
MSTSLVDECYRRAREARRSAEIASMPTQRTHFLELEQRWLRAGESVTPKIVREAKASIPEPKVVDVPRGRPTKFTPERIEQIRGLVATGMSREEIAAMLGVTVGSLQVTCSKLGISLRRPRLHPNLTAPLNLPSHEVPDTGGPISSPTKVNPVRFIFEQVDEQQGDDASLALKIHYRGLEQDVPLRLSNEVIAALALEAQLRGMSLGELAGAIVAGAVTSGLSGFLAGEPSADAPFASEAEPYTPADRE